MPGDYTPAVMTPHIWLARLPFSHCLLSSELSMRILQSVALSITLSSLAASVLADTTLITNVNGYTLDVNRTLQQFSAIQFTDDLVDAIYNTVEDAPETADTVIDGAGRTLIPGLVDAHGHVLSYGLSLLRVDVTGTSTEAEAAERVEEIGRAHV